MIGRTNAGGGGTGATLTVNAPAGVSVIATNSTTERTYTRTANSSGVAVFKGLPTGTYSVHITDGTTTSKDFTATVVADYELTVKFFSAYINVTYPGGSMCTCTDGNTTLTATDTSGSYQFVVPSTGTWTVSCTDGEQSTSASVTITADEQLESVTLAYFAATISITYPATSSCVVKNSSGATVASDTNTGSSTKTWTATVQAAGTYTVTATATSDSSKTKSQSVSITADGQSTSVTLQYILYLYNSGDQCTAITGGWSTRLNIYSNIFTNSYIWSGNLVNSGNNGNIWTTNAGEFYNQYKTLKVLYKGGVSDENPMVGLVSSSTSCYDMNNNGLSNYKARKVFSVTNSQSTASLDISSITSGSYRVLFLNMYSFYIYKVWLE